MSVDKRFPLRRRPSNRKSQIANLKSQKSHCALSFTTFGSAPRFTARCARASQDPNLKPMKIMKPVIQLTIATVATATLVGCHSTPFNPGDAQATAQAPEAAQVEPVTLPYDAALPTFVVAILPFNFGASGVTSGGGVTPSAPSANGSLLGILTGGLQGGGTRTSSSGGAAPPSAVGVGIAAQLRTALAQWQNVSVMDPATLVKQSDGTYTCKLGKGELGPFLISGTVTEFNETAGLNEKKRGGSLGGLGSVLGIAGAFGGSTAAAATGAGIAAANPSYQNQKMKRTGMVGMDLQIENGHTGRLLPGGAFNSSGSFTTVSAVSGLSVFGVGGGNADFAASALGQATRAAMNDALTKTAGVLRRAATRR